MIEQVSKVSLIPGNYILGPGCQEHMGKAKTKKRIWDTKSKPFFFFPWEGNIHILVIPN